MWNGSCFLYQFSWWFTSTYSSLPIAKFWSGFGAWNIMQPPNWSLPISSPNRPWKQVWVANSPIVRKKSFLDQQKWNVTVGQMYVLWGVQRKQCLGRSSDSTSYALSFKITCMKPAADHIISGCHRPHLASPKIAHAVSCHLMSGVVTPRLLT